MRKFAQILNGKAHWIFEAEEKPEFAPNIVLIDITDLSIQPEEGWDYDKEKGTFTQPVSETPILPETLEQKMERLEQQVQNDNLILMEVMATIYEELLASKGSV